MSKNTIKCLLVGPRLSGVSSLCERITSSPSTWLAMQNEQRRKSYRLAGIEVLYYALQANPLNLKYTFLTHASVDAILLIADLSPDAAPIEEQLSIFQICIDAWQGEKCHIFLVGQKSDLLTEPFAKTSRYNQLLDYATDRSIRLANPIMVSAHTGKGVAELEKHLVSFFARTRVEQLWEMLSQYAKPEHSFLHWLRHPKRHWVKQVDGVLQRLQSDYQNKKLSLRAIYQALEKSITLSTIYKNGDLYAILEQSMYTDLPYLLPAEIQVEEPSKFQKPLF